MLDTPAELERRRRFVRLPAARVTSVLLCALLAFAPQAARVADAQTTASDCPNGGTIRFGVEPYEDAALLAPAYQPLADALGKALNCTQRGGHSFAYSDPASTSGHLY